MEERVIYLAVNIETGGVDYGYVEYDLREEPTGEAFRLIEGWEWRPFKIVALPFETEAKP